MNLKEDKLKSFLINFGRDITRIHRLNNKKYNIAIIGIGDIGYHITDKLSILGPGRINQLIVSNLNQNAGNLALLEDSVYTISLTFKDYDKIDKWVYDEEIDLSIISAGERCKNRLNELQPSTKIITDLARSFRGYKGSTLIVTNPLDLMTYLFASESQCNPYSVFGFSHVDVVRGKKGLFPILNEQIRSFFSEGDELVKENQFKTPEEISLDIIGAHYDNCMIPYLNRTKIGITPITRLNFFTREFYNQLKEAISNYGWNLCTLSKNSRGSASDQASTVLARDVFDAISNETSVVSLSIWNSEKGAYTSWPTKFRDIISIPQKLDLSLDDPSKWCKLDFEKVCEEYLQRNLDSLNKGGNLTLGLQPPIIPKIGTHEEKLERLVHESDKLFEELTKDINKENILYKKFKKLYDKIKENRFKKIYNSNLEILDIDLTEVLGYKTPDENFEDYLRTKERPGFNKKSKMEMAEEEFEKELRKKRINQEPKITPPLELEERFDDLLRKKKSPLEE